MDNITSIHRGDLYRQNAPIFHSYRILG